MFTRSKAYSRRQCLSVMGALCVAGFVLAAPASVIAEEQVMRTSVQVRVGETRQIAVVGAHRRDCVTSVAPNAIEVVQPPRLGTLAQRQGVSYVAEHSISGTCLGSRFFGTAVEYTARAPGSDTVAFDTLFDNGRVHRIVAITVVQ